MSEITQITCGAVVGGCEVDEEEEIVWGCEERERGKSEGVG